MLGTWYIASSNTTTQRPTQYEILGPSNSCRSLDYKIQASVFHTTRQMIVSVTAYAVWNGAWSQLHLCKSTDFKSVQKAQ